MIPAEVALLSTTVRADHTARGPRLLSTLERRGAADTLLAKDRLEIHPADPPVEPGPLPWSSVPRWRVLRFWPSWLGELWRHPEFVKLWTGSTISLFGTSITSLAFPLTAVL